MNKEEVLPKLGQEVIISYMSDVKLTGGKKNPQLNHISKVTENLLVTLTKDGQEYQKRMQENVDSNFVSSARPWGHRTAEGLIEHNGELYVEFLVEGRGVTKYLLDGQPIDKSQINGLPKVPVNDTGVIIRSVKLSNLLTME